VFDLPTPQAALPTNTKRETGYRDPGDVLAAEARSLLLST